MGIVHDRRTTAQQQTHTVVVFGTDPMLSGWGKAANGLSVAGWACRPEDVDKVEEWVKSRSDVYDVRVSDGEIPECAHMSVYVVDKDHPAMRGSK